MPKYEIKTVVTGADQAARDLQKEGAALKGVTTEAQKTASASDDLTSKKNKLTQALKKLHDAIPGLGISLAALKNPFVLLAAAIGFAVNAFNKFKEKVDEMAKLASNFDTLNLSIRDFAEVIKANEADRTKFIRDLAAIANKAKDATTYFKELNDEIDRKYTREEKTGDQSPEAKAAREFRKREAKATAAFNAGTRARELADVARHALPGAETELNQATLAREQAGRVLAAEKAFSGSGAREALVLQIRDLEANTAPISELYPPTRKQKQLIEAREKLAAIDNGEKLASGKLRGATERETIAKERVGTLRSQVLTGEEQFRTFRGEATQEFNALTADRRIEGIVTGPVTSGPLQARYEALLESLLRMTSDAQRRVDAISKENADRAARERTQSMNQR